MPAWKLEISLPKIFRGIVLLQMAMTAWLLIEYIDDPTEWERLEMELGDWSVIAPLIPPLEIILPFTSYIGLLLLRRWGRLLFIPWVIFSIAFPILSGLYCETSDSGRSIALYNDRAAAVVGSAIKYIDGGLLALMWTSELKSIFTRSRFKAESFLVLGAVIVISGGIMLVYLTLLGQGMGR